MFVLNENDGEEKGEKEKENTTMGSDVNVEREG
jgi:hypothetical protein